MAARMPGALVLAIAMLLSVAGFAIAQEINGTSGADRLLGAKQNDTIRGRAGDDRLAGKRGDDRLVGGRGRDEIAGGPGDDRCVTDREDAVPVGCETVIGPAAPMTVTSTTGNSECLVLRRAENCYFVIQGSGADESSGTVTGAGDVEVTPPSGEVSARRDGGWDASGIYSCNGPGTLIVTIGPESVEVPVACAPGFGGGP